MTLALAELRSGKLDANGVEEVLAYVKDNSENTDVAIALGTWIRDMLKKVNDEGHRVSAVIYDNPVPELITKLSNGEITVSKILTIVSQPPGIDLNTLPVEQRREHLTQFDVVLGMVDGKIHNLMDMSEDRE